MQEKHKNIVTLGIHPGGSEVKASACNAGDPGLIPGLGRSPREGNGNPLQYSCLENPMDGGAWLATVHGVPKSRTQLSDFTFTLLFRYTQWKPGVYQAHHFLALIPSTSGDFCQPHFPDKGEWGKGC